MKTMLYIDGFNVYYGAVRGTPLRWLNPIALVQRMFPKNEIIGAKYFSARVDPRSSDTEQPLRQAIYWRALRTLPNLEIIEGHFRVRQVNATVVRPPPRFIWVYKTEEKGSDVNLAAHLLMDGFRNRYEVALVVSGDSDLVSPIRMVREQLRKPVGVLNPQRLSGPNPPDKRKNAGLQHAASFYRDGVRWQQLVDAQFANPLTDTDGTFHKPASWGEP